MHITILTITDAADFSRVMHQSAWTDLDAMQRHAKTLTLQYMEDARHHWQGRLVDTFDVSTTAFTVNRPYWG